MKETILNYKDKVMNFTENNETVKKLVSPYKKQSDKNKKIILFGILGVFVFSILVTIFLNVSGNRYKVLYPGIDSKETGEVMSVLKDMGVDSKLDGKTGEVMVPSKDYDVLLLDLTAQGYPKTAPAYGIFKDNAGFTTTEFEKKQYLVFNLQDKIEKTLKGLDDVTNADVTIVVPEDSAYVLDNKTKSTAAVAVTMRPGARLSPQKVDAFKNLVAYSVPKMEPQDVAVVDSRTGLTMKGDIDSGTSSNGTQSLDFERLGFEDRIESKINEKVLSVLGLGYKPEDMRVQSTVTVDYDKMITEEVEYIPGENGEGVKEKFEESYQNNGNQNSGAGIPGEENNTDIPTYPNDENANADKENYTQSAEYLVSYIKQQIEKDKAVLKDVSIAVSVLGKDLSEDRREEMVNTVAKAANINPENVQITTFEPNNSLLNNAIIQEVLNNPLILAGIPIGLVALGLGLILMKKKKSKKSNKSIKDTDAADAEDLALKMKKELEDEKRKLVENAKAGQPVESLVVEDIKGFVKENPEITASLIRNWLKDDEE
ncbi:MAG: flagellar basal-body MS-ring/collar protein FliF [Oscillospiraceae bacterium]